MNIEEAAEKYAENGSWTFLANDSFYVMEEAFKAGALSDAAKQYWFDIFIKQALILRTPKAEQKQSAGEDETDKIVKELDYLFEKYIGKMFGKVESASIEHFLKTGTINGTFRFRLSAMIAEAIGNSTDAIEFAEWLSGEGYRQYDGAERWIAPHNSNRVYLTKELYEIFKANNK